MRTVYGLALERARVRIVLLAVGFGLFELVVGLSYASVDQNAIRQLVDALPPALRALAGSADIASPTGYAGSGYLHPVALAIQGAIAISMAAAPAREAEDGTAELVLSRPIPPPLWLGAHALAMATGLAVVVAGGYAGGLAAALSVDDLSTVRPGPLAGALAMGFLLFLAVGGVALLVASLVRTGRPRDRLGGRVPADLLRARLPGAGLVDRRAPRAAVGLPLPRPAGDPRQRLGGRRGRRGARGPGPRHHHRRARADAPPRPHPVRRDHHPPEPPAAHPTNQETRQGAFDLRIVSDSAGHLVAGRGQARRTGTIRSRGRERPVWPSLGTHVLGAAFSGRPRRSSSARGVRPPRSAARRRDHPEARRGARTAPPRNRPPGTRRPTRPHRAGR